MHGCCKEIDGAVGITLRLLFDYLEEIRIPLHRAGFETLPVEGEQLPVLWNDAPLCRITGKGSVFYRREDADTPQAEDALFRVEDIAAKTLEL